MGGHTYHSDDNAAYREDDCFPDELPWQPALQPRYSFNTVNEFSVCHRKGTEAEFIFESWQIGKFNQKQFKFLAWPIMTVLHSKPPTTWLLLVAPGPPGSNDALLPKEGESCRAEVVAKMQPDQPKIAKNSASRVDNPCAGWGVKDAFWQSCMAFEVFLWCNDSSNPPKVGPGEKPSVTLTPALPRKVFKDGFTEIPKFESQKLSITFELRLSRSTRDAEIGALNKLKLCRELPSAETKKQVAAFEYFVTLNPKQHSSLFDVFPHMSDPFLAPKKVQKKLMERFSAFDTQQKQAYRSLLGSIPDGICMVPGGPGAGKTFWNLSVAASLQAKDEIKKPGEDHLSESRNTVLYLLDINRPLTDVANKMVKVYKDLGWTKVCCNDCGVTRPRSVVRMFCWSYESSAPTLGYITAQRNELDRRRERLKNGQHPEDGKGPLSKYEEKADKTERVVLQGFAANFFKIVTMSEDPQTQPSTEKDCFAKTLDEAAAEYYQRHRDTKYANVRAFLPMEAHSYGLEALKDHLIEVVYRDTLDNADFVATTPVTASKFSRALFDPTLVIFDEAPHARDLSLLISIARFNPHAWILTGDHRQTKPFVGSHGRNCNQYAEQLRVSVMERADRKEGNTPSLLINHRAWGNLQELASKLFYNSKMMPAKSPDELGAMPREAMYLREKYIMPMKNGKGPMVSRLLVVLKRCGLPQKEQSSWHNEGHRDWVVKLIRKFTQDTRFQQIKSAERGTILVMSPYKRAVIEYGKAFRDLRKSREGLGGCTVEARTVDTAQGHEADVCILDFVHYKCTPHLEDANRMCVALTRARQAEFVIMHEDMVEDVENGCYSCPNMARMIAYCRANGQFVHGPGAV